MASPALVSSAVSDIRVLIVDQDPVITNLVARYVGHFLHNVAILEANTASIALSLVDPSYVWAFVVDVDLPDWEGTLLLCELLARCPGSVAVRSGSQLLVPLDHPRLLASLVKPYDVHVLTIALCDALTRSNCIHNAGPASTQET